MYCAYRFLLIYSLCDPDYRDKGFALSDVADQIGYP